jgi:beta-galactosidase
MTNRLITTLVFAGIALAAAAQPAGRTSFNEGWTFEKDGASRKVDLPHDWGVEGDFRQEYPGESGKLAWWGQATYRKELEISAEDLTKDIDLEIDGAMSHATVEVNGVDLGGWPYGYASFAIRLNPALKPGRNKIRVHIDNPEESSRWYPGGGIYRNVWLTKTNKTSVAHWGTYLTTEIGIVNRTLNQADAKVALRVTLKHAGEKTVGMVRTQIIRQDRYKRDGKEVTVDRVLAETRSIEYIEDGKTVLQTFDLEGARLWTPEDPTMYLARTTVETPDEVLDRYETPFGVRSAEWKADGFYLNGDKTFLKGVCLHHDAGALGAVWNDDAWVRRFRMLKEMGCNAIRTSHNPPAPEFLDLCDRMGFLVLDELTDTWTVPKKEHGYAELFDEWVEKDLVAMIRRDRNHPSVIAWSIGNECGEQGMAEKWDIPRRLTAICHREDPTRPTTAGNDNPWASSQPYAETIDLYGFNYKPHLYAEFRDAHPGQPVYGSETASCISTRGYYRFPVEEEKGLGWSMEAPFQVSSYDLYAPGWASKPDYEWAFEDQVPECAGEFVWTGYDYLGEPTPFNMDPSVLTNFHTEEEREAFKKMVAGWGQVIADVPLPSRSSYFGIIDLAGFPKDRYWLYQARWRPELPMVHVLPHWTWPGREGQVTPVHVYTSGDEAELFLNGKSLGRKAREGYRLRWDDVIYQPGTLKVVAYKDGRFWAETEVRTAGPAARAAMEVDFAGEDLVFVTTRLLDKAGNFDPTAYNKLTYKVSGPGDIVATDAGDPTCHTPFTSHTIDAFNGLCSVIVRRTGAGSITVSVSPDGLKTEKIVLP